jgi:hypothetical protein
MELTVHPVLFQMTVSHPPPLLLGHYIAVPWLLCIDIEQFLGTLSYAATRLSACTTQK